MRRFWRRIRRIAMRGLGFLRTNWLGVVVIIALAVPTYMLWQWWHGVPAAPASGGPAAGGSATGSTAGAPASSPAADPASARRPGRRRGATPAVPAATSAPAPVSAGPDWERVFADKLGDPNPAVRSGVVDCIVSLDAVGAFPILVGLMVDKNEPVAQHSAKALIDLGDKAIEPLIAAGLKSGDEKLMERSSIILTKIGTPGVTASLIDVLSDPNQRVRYYAKRALYLLGANLALEGTIRMDGNPLRTAEAQDALLWIRNRKPLVSWAPTTPTPNAIAPQQEVEALKAQLAALEGMVTAKEPGKVVYVDGRDKIVPAVMPWRTYLQKIQGLPDKEKRALIECRKLYEKIMAEKR